MIFLFVSWLHLPVYAMYMYANINLILSCRSQLTNANKHLHVLGET